MRLSFIINFLIASSQSFINMNLIIIDTRIFRLWFAIQKSGTKKAISGLSEKKNNNKKKVQNYLISIV